MPRSMAGPLLHAYLGPLLATLPNSLRIGWGIPQGIPQVGIPQVGIPQVGIPQVGIPQVGIPQVGIPQSGFPQSSHFSGHEIRALQIINIEKSDPSSSRH